MPLIILKWKNWFAKVRRIHENGAQNLQVTRAEFSCFWHRILTTLTITRTTKIIVIIITNLSSGNKKDIQQMSAANNARHD